MDYLFPVPECESGVRFSCKGGITASKATEAKEKAQELLNFMKRSNELH
jgi:hypothetical protein